MRIAEAGRGTSAETLVLLHGIGGHLEAYSKNIVPLSDRFHVVAYEIDDPRSASEQILTIQWRHYFYQTAWFNALCGLVVTTAAWGSYENRWVRVLRQFRDVVLLPTHAGSRFVDWYYAHSPGPAAYIAVHPWARQLTRLALWPVILKVNVPIEGELDVRAVKVDETEPPYYSMLSLSETLCAIDESDEALLS